MREFNFIESLIGESFSNQENVLVKYDNDSLTKRNLLYQYDETKDKSEADGFNIIDPDKPLDEQGQGTGQGALILKAYEEVCDTCNSDICSLEEFPTSSFNPSSSWQSPDTEGLSNKSNIGEFDPIMKGRLIIKNPCSKIFVDIVNKECFWKTNVNTDGCNPADEDKGGNQPQYRLCGDEKICDLLEDGTMEFAFTFDGNSDDLCQRYTLSPAVNSFTLGKCGQAWDCNADHTNRGFNFSLGGKRAYSVSLWFRDSNQSGDRKLMVNENGYRNASVSVRFTGTNYHAHCSDSTRTWEDTTFDISQWLDGEWHHLVQVIYNDKMYLWIDRVMVKEYQMTVYGGWDAGGYLRFATGRNPGYEFLGAMQLVRFINKACNQEDVNKLYYEAIDEL